MTTGTYTLPRRPVPPRHPVRSSITSLLGDPRRQALGYVIGACAWMLGTRALLESWLARGMIGPEDYALALLARPVALVAVSAIVILRHLDERGRAERQSERIAEAMRGICALIDQDGMIAYANAAFLRKLSLSCAPRARLPLATVLAPYLSPRHAGALLPAEGESIIGLVLNTPFGAPDPGGPHPGAPHPGAARGGVTATHEIRVQRLEDGDATLGWILTGIDGIETQALRADHALKSHALDTAIDGIVISDLRAPDMPLIYVNRAFQDITGYASAELLGRNPRFLQGSDRLQPEIARLRERIARHQPVTVTLRNYRRDGTLFWNEMRLSPASDVHGVPSHYIGIVRDVSVPRRTLEELERLAYVDPVTTLRNRAGFVRALAGVLAGAAGTVLLITLDVIRYDDIVGAFGEAAGDALLAGIAERLRAYPGVVLAGRLRDNTFGIAIALPEETGAEETGAGETGPEGGAGRAVAAAREMLRAPFRLRDGDVELLFSVGTALGRRGMTAATLLHQALVALNQSQRTQVGGTRAFDATADEDIRRRVGLRQDLREAITSGDFTLHLQPMVALADGAWVGAEALVRWRHPVFGLQSPGLFLSVSEQTGQILDIDDWALRHAAGLAARLNQGGLDQGPLAVSVNLSAPRLRHANLAPMLAAVLRDTGADPASLRIEIAEPVLAGGSGAMIEDLRRLRAMGVGIVIDDFGVGGSSLSSLDTLPVTEIKIDRGFIQDCESSAYHQLVIGSFVAIGRTLAIAVTAKGVANEAQRRVLERLGVRQAQGFLFGAPIDAAEFTALARPRGGSGPAAAGGHRLE